jgi:hypothetical protein
MNSSVGIATSYGMGGLDSIPNSAEFFSSPQRPDRQWGPPSLLSNGYRWLFSRWLKRPGCEADHSPPSRAEVKNAGTITPLPFTSSWLGDYLVKHRNNSALCFTIKAASLSFKYSAIGARESNTQLAIYFHPYCILTQQSPQPEAVLGEFNPVYKFTLLP